MKAKDFAEIVGIGAVVVSLSLLTYELRQNTMATQQAAAANYAQGHRDIELFAAGDAEFAELILTAISGDDLTGLERFRLDLFYRSILRAWQNSYFQYRAGGLTEEVWSAELRFMSSIAPDEAGMLSHWRREKYVYTEEFVELFDSLISESDQ